MSLSRGNGFDEFADCQCLKSFKTAYTTSIISGEDTALQSQIAFMIQCYSITPSNLKCKKALDFLAHFIVTSQPGSKCDTVPP